MIYRVQCTVTRRNTLDWLLVQCSGNKWNYRFDYVTRTTCDGEVIYSIHVDSDKLNLKLGGSIAASALLHAENMFIPYSLNCMPHYWRDELGKVRL